jgi:hypothetical protein
MRRLVSTGVLVAAGLLVSTGLSADKPAPASKSVKLAADDGVVATSGAVVKDGSALKVDVIAYKHGDGLDLKGGRTGTTHQPLHKFGLSQKFAALKDVPCTAPEDKEKNAFLSKAKAGQGFTVKGNKSAGVYRVWVKSVKDGKATLEYQKCP